LIDSRLKATLQDRSKICNGLPFFKQILLILSVDRGKIVNDNFRNEWQDESNSSKVLALNSQDDKFKYRKWDALGPRIL
jgi:hypothetical protein